MENYICINGKKAELTEEQLKTLGIELPKANPFARVYDQHQANYYFINNNGEVTGALDMWDVDDIRYDIANYCTDRKIMKQRALHETLNRLLWRYSMEHGAEEINWEDREQQKWEICYDHSEGKIEVFDYVSFQTIGSVYFASYQAAWNAIEEIIEPFMKAHPEFKF